MKEVLEKALEVATRQHEQWAYEEDTANEKITALSEARRVANAYRAHWANLMASLRVAISDCNAEGGAS